MQARVELVLGVRTGDGVVLEEKGIGDVKPPAVGRGCEAGVNFDGRVSRGHSRHAPHCGIRACRLVHYVQRKRESKRRHGNLATIRADRQRKRVRGQRNPVTGGVNLPSVGQHRLHAGLRHQLQSGQNQRRDNRRRPETGQEPDAPRHVNIEEYLQSGKCHPGAWASGVFYRFSLNLLDREACCLLPDASLKPNASVKKVLIYRLGSLGDTVVALPCFHLIERTFPQAERVLLSNFPVHAKAPASAAVLGSSGLVHGYMRYTVGTRNPLELLGLAWQIRRFRPDVLGYLMPVRPLKSIRRDRLFFRLAGVRRILGLPNAEGLNHRFDAATGLYEAEAFRLARQLHEVGDARVEDLDNWTLNLTDAERQTAASVLGDLRQHPLIVCGPGTKMQAKDWGQENWRALLVRLQARYPGHGLALIGAREDGEAAEFAASQWAGPMANLCGRLSPRETAAVIERARVFLGPDSGPMHLAASVRVPCVIAFSARGLPGTWYPAGQNQIVYHQTGCYGCQLETCTVEARRCLTSITVDEMAAAVGRALGVQAG